MPIKYLTSVRPDLGKADSVLMGLKGVRLAAMEEPDNNAYVNGASACELTGGRDLFCANVEYRPQFVPYLACNNLPGIDNDNGGARTRMRKSDYVSRFVLGGEVDDGQPRVSCRPTDQPALLGMGDGRDAAAAEHVRARVRRALPCQHTIEHRGLHD